MNITSIFWYFMNITSPEGGNCDCGLRLSVSMGMSVSVRVSVRVTMGVTCRRNPKCHPNWR